MAGFRESFGGNVDFAYGQRAAIGRQMDLAGGIERGLAGIGGFAKKAGEASAAVRELNKELTGINAQYVAAQLAGDTKEMIKLREEAKRTQKQISELNKSLKGMPLDAIEKGLGSLTKGLLKFNTSLLGLGFDFVIDSLKRVYELQERWAKAIGGFNLQLGGMTKGLGGATRAAAQWSSTLRGLTNGDIAEGIQMFGEFAMTLGRLDKAIDFKEWGIEAARGFNLGGAGAAKLAETLDSMGDSGKEMNQFLGADLVKSANAAGVPINLLAKDISESTDYMARFGKEGQKTFVQGAAFAHKFYMSIKDVQRSVEGLDMFDEAARTASKLNTVFGTMINSMDLMMEDDPAKRIEMIRQQFLALGKTEDKLSPKEIRYLSDTMHLTEQQTRALLSQQNAKMSYADFQKKAMASEKEEADAKRNMELMLRKTAQTLFAFGVAFDKVTLAIANAIKPMLKVFGLAGQGEKGFKSFGEVMSGITDTVVEFFNSLAKDPRWNNFMEELAKDMISAGHALKEFVLSGHAAKMVGDMASAMKDFYVWVRDLAKDAVPYLEPLGRAFMFLAKHVEAIAAAWLSIKTIGGAKKIFGSISSIFGGSGQGGAAAGGAGALGGIRGMVNGAASGPIMAIAGTAIGWSINRITEAIVDYINYDPRKEQVEKVISNNQVREAKMTMESNVIAAKKAQLDTRHLMADKILLELQQKSRPLRSEEIDVLRERIEGLQGFGKHADLAAKALKDLHPGAKLSADELRALRENTQGLNVDTQLLSNVDKLLYDRESADLQLQLKKAKIDEDRATNANLDAQIEEAQKEADEAKKAAPGSLTAGASMAMFGGLSADQMKRMSEAAQAQKRLQELQNKKQDRMLVVSNEERDLAKENLRQLKIQTILAQQSQFIAQAQAHGYKTNEEIAQYVKNQFWTQEGMLTKVTGIEKGDYEDIVRSQFGEYTPQRMAKKMAGGGVVSRPTRAIIGESGPEAVIPLRAMARGRMRQPDQFGGRGAQGMVSGGGGDRVIVVATDVHIDGQKAGRAITRAHITGRQ